MFEATFEATLRAHDPERQRHLTLAALIALAMTATSIAAVATLERLGVDRVSGPIQQFELLSLSFLPPPPPVETPPPPLERGDQAQSSEAQSAIALVEPREDLLEDESPELGLTQPRAPKLDGIPSGPGNGAIPGKLGCPAGLCTGIPRPPVGPACTGPLCGGGGAVVPGPPKQVEFSALRCLACADPDQAALRKSVASSHARSGSVIVKFCVDPTGRVDKRSIAVSRSFGVAAVDQVTLAAIRNWRFSPFEVAGQPRRACSRAVFNIRFD